MGMMIYTISIIGREYLCSREDRIKCRLKIKPCGSEGCTKIVRNGGVRITYAGVKDVNKKSTKEEYALG